MGFENHDSASVPIHDNLTEPVINFEGKDTPPSFDQADAANDSAWAVSNDYEPTEPRGGDEPVFTPEKYVPKY